MKKKCDEKEMTKKTAKSAQRLKIENVFFLTRVRGEFKKYKISRYVFSPLCLWEVGLVYTCTRQVLLVYDCRMKDGRGGENRDHWSLW